MASKWMSGVEAVDVVDVARRLDVADSGVRGDRRGKPVSRYEH